MKIRFESYNNLLLNKILKLHMLTVIVTSVMSEEKKLKEYQKKLLSKTKKKTLLHCIK